MAGSSSHKLDLYIQAHNQADGAIRDVSTGLLGVVAAAKAAGLGFNGVLAGVTAVGGALAVVGGLLTGFSKQSVGAATEFEQAMANVKAIAGDSEEAFQKLTDRATELGMQTKFTASQAAEGMRFLAMTGYDANEVLAAIGPALDLAAASGMELAQTADILSNILTGFGLGAESAKSAANALAVVASKSNTNIQQMGEAMKYAANAAASAGLSINQAAAAVGVLGDSGIQASMAGTNLRGMLITLASPSNKAKEAFERLGVEIVKGKDGSIDLIATLERLKAANWKLADAADIFNRRVAAGAIALTKNVEKMRMLEWQTKVSTTSLEQMRDVMLATYSGAKVKLQSALNALSTTLGTHFLGALTVVTAALTKIVGWLKILADTFPTLTKVTVYAVTIFGVLTASVGSLMLVMGGLSLLLSAVIGKETMLAAVEAVRSQGIKGLVVSYWAKIQAIMADSAARKANTLATHGNTIAIETNTLAADGNTYAMLRNSAAQVEGGVAARMASGDFGLVGRALSKVKDVLVRAGSWVGNLGARMIAAASVSGGLTAALGAVKGAFLALFGAAAGWVALVAALVVGVFLLARELTGAGAVARSVQREIDGYSDAIARAEAEMAKLREGVQLADGTMRKVNFYPRSLEQLQNLRAEDFTHYVRMLEVETTRVAALFKKLAVQRQQVFDPEKDLDKQSAEYVALTSQMKQLKVAIGELGQARRNAKRLDQGDLGEPDSIAAVTEEIERLGGETENLREIFGESAEEARARLEEMTGAAQEAAKKITDSYDEIEKKVDRFSEDTELSLDKVSEKWREVSADTDRTLAQGRQGFSKYLEALNKAMENSTDLFSTESEKIERALKTAIREGASSRELEALKDNFKDISESGIRAFESLSEEAGASLRSLRQQYLGLTEEIREIAERSERERYNVTQQYEEAKRDLRRRTMSDEQRYYNTVNDMESKLALAKKLAAQGDEESIRRAQELRREVMRQAQSLNEVKKGKTVIISQDQAQTQALGYLNKANSDYHETSKKAEKAAIDAKEEQKKQIEAQIKKLEELKVAADKAVESIRKEMRVQIDDADAKIKLEKLAEERRVKFVVDLEVNKKAADQYEQKMSKIEEEGAYKVEKARKKDKASWWSQKYKESKETAYKWLEAGGNPWSFFVNEITKAINKALGASGMATGGPVPGSGTGDTVPAMLTPGEYVVKAQAVKKYGRGLMAALNNMSLELPRFATGGLVEAPTIDRGNRGSNGGVSNETERILNNFARTLSSIGDKFQKGQQITIRVNSDGSATLTGGGNVDLLG